MFANKYDEESLRQINNNVNLLEYAEQSFELKRRGEQYYAHCPLHIDKTPSLCIFPKDNTFHCFSCKVGGGIINWLYYIEKIPYDDAVKKAAALANYDLSKMCKSETMLILRKNHNALQRKTERHEHKTLEKSVLLKYRKEYPEEWLEEGIKPWVMDIYGIAIDDFSNRIIYPVYDIRGNLINIKGRTRYEDYKELGIAKYINYYKVGCMDYFQGLNYVLDDVKAANEIIVFESIKSVMKCYGWGFKNCVSAETHTFSDEQINLLVKLRVDITLAFDSDVDCWQGKTRKTIQKLKRFTNVYLVREMEGLLGGKESKNSPADCGEEVWRKLYERKRKVV